MKKVICFILCFSLLLFGSTPIYASEPENVTETIEYFEDGSYCVTIIEVEPDNNLFSMFSTTKTKTGKKTSTYKNSAGANLWSVAITGTFSYSGTSSTCTNATVATTVFNTAWRINSKSAQKSGNRATGTASASVSNGVLWAGPVTSTVTLTCSASGVLS